MVVCNISYFPINFKFMEGWRWKPMQIALIEFFSNSFIREERKIYLNHNLCNEVTTTHVFRLWYNIRIKEILQLMKSNKKKKFPSHERRFTVDPKELLWMSVDNPPLSHAASHFNGCKRVCANESSLELLRPLELKSWTEASVFHAASPPTTVVSLPQLS